MDISCFESGFYLHVRGNGEWLRPRLRVVKPPHAPIIQARVVDFGYAVTTNRFMRIAGKIGQLFGVLYGQRRGVGLRAKRCTGRVGVLFHVALCSLLLSTVLEVISLCRLGNNGQTRNASAIAARHS